MNMLLPIIISVLIVVIAGLILVWWLTGRIVGKGLRRLLRTIAVPGYIIALLAIGLTTVRSQLPAGPQTQALSTVSESTTVEVGSLTQTLKATGTLDVAENTVLNFKTSAPVAAVMVKVGDHVKAGDVLATADTTDLEAKVRDAQISLTQAQNSLNELTAPPRDIDIKIYKADIEASKASLSVAAGTGSSANDIQIAEYKAEIAKNQLWQGQLNRDISNDNTPHNPNAYNAYSDQIKTDSSLAQSESSVQIAEADASATASNGPNQSSLGSANASLVSAQANLDSLLAGATDTEVRQAKIAVETAQLSLDAAKKSLDDATIKAPFDGLVAAVDIVKGEVPPATGAITMLDTSRFTTTIAVDEKDIASLQLGQSVNLTVQAIGNSSIPATVTRIEPAPKTSSGLVTYNVEVTLNSADAKLRPGMSTVANVVLGQQDNVIVVPNRFITTDATTQKSTVKVQTAAGTYSDVPVTIGAHTDSDSVITSGVSVGQTLVILAATTTAPGSFFPAPPGGGAGGPGGGGFPGGGG
ncbi:MAG: HlyD family efflux transporter periplasmic adaptor subunit [Anaerolineaceae bacterium]|nr:HlyD family efflux transporter periplasmic adaptor subunit [Anaerolineaceae bacterium]